MAAIGKKNSVSRKKPATNTAVSPVRPPAETPAALLYVACLMTRGLAEIDWRDVTEYAPAVVTAVAMPLTYSIATGIGLGFITYALIKIVAGKFADASPAIIGLAALFALKFAISG